MEKWQPKLSGLLSGYVLRFFQFTLIAPPTLLPNILLGLPLPRVKEQESQPPAAAWQISDVQAFLNLISLAQFENTVN